MLTKHKTKLFFLLVFNPLFGFSTAMAADQTDMNAPRTGFSDTVKIYEEIAYQLLSGEQSNQALSLLEKARGTQSASSERLLQQAVNFIFLLSLRENHYAVLAAYNAAAQELQDRHFIDRNSYWNMMDFKAWFSENLMRASHENEAQVRMIGAMFLLLQQITESNRLMLQSEKRRVQEKGWDNLRDYLELIQNLLPFKDPSLSNRNLIDVQRIGSELQKRLEKMKTIMVPDEWFTLISSVLLDTERIQRHQKDNDQSLESVRHLFQNAYLSASRNEFNEANEKLIQGLEILFPGLSQPLREKRFYLHLLRLRAFIASLSDYSLVSADQWREMKEIFDQMSGLQDQASFLHSSQLLRYRILEVYAKSTLNPRYPLDLFSLSPSHGVRAMIIWIQGLQRVVEEARFELDNSRSFSRRIIEKLSPSNAHKALDVVENSLEGIATRLKHATSLVLAEKIIRAHPEIQLLTRFTLESAVKYSHQATTYADEFYYAKNRLLDSPRHFLSNEQYRTILQTVQKEGKEDIWRIWTSRQMVKVYALSALLAAEAVAIPFSGGSSATAMPATLFAIHTATLGLAKTVLIGSASLDIADRYSLGGWKGLANLDTAFDVLIIITLSPRITPKPVADLSGWGKTGQTFLNQVGSLQRSTGWLITLGMSGYAGYMLLNAQNISYELQQEGFAVTPNEIRIKALSVLALALVSGVNNYMEHRTALSKYGESYVRANQELAQTRNQRLMYYVPVYKPLTEFLKNPGLWKGVTESGKGLLGLAGAYILGGTSALVYFSTPDSVFENAVEKRSGLPDLKPGESAVSLIGFSPSDPLYSAARAKNMHVEQRMKWGNRYLIYDFDCPEKFIKQLDSHAEKHGKIRYLRIMTHGRPGRLWTQKLGENATNAQVTPYQKEYDELPGWIDTRWLNENSGTLLPWSRRNMADSALIVLYACLAGANLEDRSSPHGVDSTGDSFLSALGRDFMPGGGDVYGSIRVLLGVESVLGGLAFESQYAGEKMTYTGTAFDQRISGYLSNPEKLVTEQEEVNSTESPKWGTDVEPRGEERGGNDTLKFTLHRLISMYSYFPIIIKRYGVDIEGSIWSQSNRIEHLRIEPH